MATDAITVSVKLAALTASNSSHPSFPQAYSGTALVSPTSPPSIPATFVLGYLRCAQRQLSLED